MRYSPQQRKEFGEAFNYLHGRNALRYMLLSATHPANWRRRSPRKGRTSRRSGTAFAVSYDPCGATSANMRAGFAGMGLVLALAGVSVGLGLWAISKMSSLLLGKMRRPQYYPQERSRRERLAKERRRVRDRFTTAPCPEPEQLLAQYEKAKTGAREAIVFGSMLCDLEAYCDNSLIRNEDGEITGRNPGMKGWIRDNCPKLLAHYKNAMRYKGLAEKFRQATGAADPVSAAALVAEDDREIKKLLDGKQVCKITVRMNKTNGPRGGKSVSGTYALNAETLEAARKCAREILAECERKDIERLRCGKTASENGEEINGDRLRSGKNAPEDGIRPLSEETTMVDERAKGCSRLRCGKARGGVARLEEILDEKLDGVPEVTYAASRWRIGGTQASEDGKCGRALATA